MKSNTFCANELIIGEFNDCVFVTVCNAQWRHFPGKRFHILDPVNGQTRTGTVYPDIRFSPTWDWERTLATSSL